MVPWLSLSEPLSLAGLYATTSSGHTLQCNTPGPRRLRRLKCPPAPSTVRRVRLYAVLGDPGAPSPLTRGIHTKAVHTEFPEARARERRDEAKKESNPRAPSATTTAAAHNDIVIAAPTQSRQWCVRCHSGRCLCRRELAFEFEATK